MLLVCNKVVCKEHTKSLLSEYTYVINHKKITCMVVVKRKLDDQAIDTKSHIQTSTMFISILMAKLEISANFKQYQHTACTCS